MQDENVIRIPNDEGDHRGVIYNEQGPSHEQNEENKEQHDNYIREINQIHISMDFQSQITVSRDENNPKIHNTEGKMI